MNVAPLLLLLSPDMTSQWKAAFRRVVAGRLPGLDETGGVKELYGYVYYGPDCSRFRSTTPERASLLLLLLAAKLQSKEKITALSE
jgi:hypothetical protein